MSEVYVSAMKPFDTAIGGYSTSCEGVHRRTRRIIAAILVVVTAVGACGSAAAFTFSPVKTSFNLYGFANIFVHRNWSCNLAMSGRVNKSGSAATIDSFFSNNCPLTAPNLPWTVRPTSANTAVLKHLSFVLNGHVCKPVAASVSVNASGVWTINNGKLDNCQFMYNSATVPAITIVP